MERIKLERRNIGTDRDLNITRCIREDGKPNCSMCHGPFYYCSKDRRLTIDDERGYGQVGCNRGKLKERKK